MCFFFRSLLSDGASKNEQLVSCLLANMTICPQSNQENFVVIVYNPLSRNVSYYVKVPVNSTLFRILDPEGAYSVVSNLLGFHVTCLQIAKLFIKLQKHQGISVTHNKTLLNTIWSSMRKIYHLWVSSCIASPTWIPTIQTPP